jgi:hypothetical protein
MEVAYYFKLFSYKFWVASGGVPLKVAYFLGDSFTCLWK